MIFNEKYLRQFVPGNFFLENNIAEKYFQKPKYEFTFRGYPGSLTHGNLILQDPEKIILFSHGYGMALQRVIKYIIPFLESGWSILITDWGENYSRKRKIASYGYFEKYDVFKLKNLAVNFISSHENDIKQALDINKDQKNTKINLNLYEEYEGTKKKIFFGLFGESMGSVIFAESLPFLQNNGGIDFCIMDSPFSDLKKFIAMEINRYLKIKAINSVVFEFVKYLIKIIGKFNPDDVSPVKSLMKTSIPILLFHGMKDNLIPYEMSVEIYEKRKNNYPTFIRLFENAGHAGCIDDDEGMYWDCVFQFINMQRKI